MKLPLLIILLLPATLCAQIGSDISELDTQQRVHHIVPTSSVVKGVAFLPGSMRQVNGLTISIYTAGKNDQQLEIRGMNMDFNPTGMFIAGYMLFFHPFMVVNKPDTTLIKIQRRPLYSYEDTMVIIKGFDLRLMGSFPLARLSGFGLTAGVGTYSDLYGVSISLFGSIAENLRGVQLSTVGNIARTGRGLQIGLFNRADACRCVQLGLLNRNGKSLMPLINWSRKG